MLPLRGCVSRGWGREVAQKTLVVALQTPATADNPAVEAAMRRSFRQRNGNMDSAGREGSHQADGALMRDFHFVIIAVALSAVVLFYLAATT